VCQWLLLPLFNHVQRPVCQQKTQFDHLLHAQRYMASRTFEIECQVTDHALAEARVSLRLASRHSASTLGAMMNRVSGVLGGSWSALGLR